MTDPKQVARAQALYDGDSAAVATIGKSRGISRATLYRPLDRPHGRQTAIKNSDNYP